MNSLVFLTLVAVAASATVASHKVAEVPDVAKESEVAEVPEDSDVAPMTDLANDEEIKYSYYYDEYGVPNRALPDYLQSLIVGVVGPDDRQIAWVTHNAAAAQFIIHNHDVTVRGAAGTNITSVQITRVGTTTNAIPTIKSGGLGKEFVTVNIKSVRSSGYSYTIGVYASIGCANS